MIHCCECDLFLWKPFWNLHICHCCFRLMWRVIYYWYSFSWISLWARRSVIVVTCMYFYGIVDSCLGVWKSHRSSHMILCELLSLYVITHRIVYTPKQIIPMHAWFLCMTLKLLSWSVMCILSSAGFIYTLCWCFLHFHPDDNWNIQAK